MKVNACLTLPKANAESEKDVVNTEKYPEDKIMALMLAYDRCDAGIMQFLLDELYMFWPLSTVKYIL